MADSEMIGFLLELATCGIYVLGINIGFIIATKQCFFDKYSFSRIVVPLFLSPSVTCILMRCLTQDLYYSNEPGRFILGFSVFVAGVIVLFAVQLLLYVKFVRPQNKSIAIFLMLICLVFSTYNDVVENLIGDFGIRMNAYIGTLIVFTEAAVFYILVIRPLSAISRTKQERGMAVFTLIPVTSVIVKLFMMFMTSYAEQMIIPAVLDIMRISKTTEQYTQIGDDVSLIVKSYSAMSTTYIIISHAIIILLIISFAVIVKNVTHINKINRQKNEIQEARDNVKALSVEVMEALAHTIDAKDKYTNGHSIRVAKYSRMIAEKMGLPAKQCEDIYYMGLLHDIGKIGVPNEIINKSSKLNNEEYDVIKTHPNIGYSILAAIKSRPDLAKGARWHHERYDGRGYPDKISGEDIPIESRIIAVADSYDAMTSNRSYRRYLPQENVRAEIEANISTQFDPDAAKCMLAIIDEDTEYVLHE